MAFNNSFTAVTGATYTAAQYNTYTRDNFTAIWVGTTAGDLDYYSSSTSKARLGIGASNTILGSSGSAPLWTHSPTIAGVLHTKGTVDFNPAGQTFSSTWADISFASVSLTLSVTCTVLVMAQVTGYNANAGTGRGFYVRAMVNGVADTGTIPFNGSQTEVHNESHSYFYYTTGVTAGSRLVKMQCQADTSNNIVERGRLIALAYVE